MITLLSAPETLTTPALAHRFLVELASIKTALDSQGIPVPAHFKTLDVCVVEPTREAITTVLKAAGHLEAYQIVDYWTPQDCDCF